jgi:hypothetical protein
VPKIPMSLPSTLGLFVPPRVSTTDADVPTVEL